MKVIDFEKRGNVVRFYLAPNDCNDYWGDDWNDVPYEVNAGTVYDEYISMYVDYALPFDSLVLEPKDDWRWQGNSPYSKEDMIEGKVPCIIVVGQDVKRDSWDSEFSYWVPNANVIKVFFNDTYLVLNEKMLAVGATQIDLDEYRLIVYLDDKSELPEPSEKYEKWEFRVGSKPTRYSAQLDDSWCWVEL